MKNSGFSLSWGEDGSGLVLLPYKKQGGFYIGPCTSISIQGEVYESWADRGASQLIIDGKIKLKSSSGGIKEFTEDGLIADDGTEVAADVVLFATGYGDPRSSICNLLDDEVGITVAPIWGLDNEGEVRGVWKEIGVPNLWAMMGNSMILCCFSSQWYSLEP